jgi:hypothetical protein
MQDLNDLFVEPASLAAWRDLRHELEAIRDGIKAISTWSFPRDLLVSEDAYGGPYTDLLELAYELGLNVVHQPTVRKAISVYIARPEQMWRAPAHRMLYEARGRGWCERVDGVESMLLGYTDEQVNAWLAARRYRSAGQGPTVYALISRSSFDELGGLGWRAFLPASFDPSVTVFAPTNVRVIRSDADSIIPADATLVRFSLRGVAEQLELHASPKADELQRMELFPKDAPRINLALGSTIQWFESGAWHNDVL